MRTLLAYSAASLGVCGHASGEFFFKLSGLGGSEVSVWRFMLGAVSLIVLALVTPGSRDLISPLRERFVPIFCLSVFGMTLGQFLFHWALSISL